MQVIENMIETEMKKIKSTKTKKEKIKSVLGKLIDALGFVAGFYLMVDKSPKAQAISKGVIALAKLKDRAETKTDGKPAETK